MKITRLRSTSLDDGYGQAADLHVAGIHHGLLPLLGRDFLARLYRELDQTSRAGVWGALEGGRVLGFLAGCADTRQCYLSVLQRAALPLSWLAGRSLLTASVLRKLPAVVQHPFRAARRGVSEETPGETRAELLAIAVHADSRGKNIGRLLVREFEQGLLAWGVRGSYTVSTNVEEVVSNGFYERVGFLPAAQVRHHALTLQVYRTQVTGDAGTSRSGNGNGAEDL